MKAHPIMVMLISAGILFAFMSFAGLIPKFNYVRDTTHTPYLEGPKESASENPKLPYIEQPNDPANEPEEAEEPYSQLQEPVKPIGYTVDITYQSFSPASLEIEEGATVTWVNNDEKSHKIYHNSVNKEFYSGVLNPGDTFSFTFENPGQYDYVDSIFKYMKGSINVKSKVSVITGKAIAALNSEKGGMIKYILSFIMASSAVLIVLFKRNHISRKIGRT